MAKRFTDTELWNEDWFLGMPMEYMLFWYYICAKCNHAGILRPNKKLFEIAINFKINLEKFLNLINEEKQRIIILDNGRWFICGFISFQYGKKLNIRSHMHKSIVELLDKNLISYKSNDYDFEVSLGSREGQRRVKGGSKKGQGRVKDRVKDKDKDKDKDVLVNSLNEEDIGLDINNIKVKGKKEIEIQHELQIYIIENFPDVAKIKEQLTNEQCIRLIKDHGRKLVIEKLEALDDQFGKLKSGEPPKTVYRTINKWCQNERNNQTRTPYVDREARDADSANQFIENIKANPYFRESD